MHTSAGDAPARANVRRSRRASVQQRVMPTVELLIVGVGLAASVIAGVVAYRVVGPYGDGPLSVGYRRVIDRDTGRSVLVHESRAADGTVVRRVIERRRLTELHFEVHADGKKEQARVHVKGSDIARVDRDRDGDGLTDVWEYYDAKQRLAKAGFSLAGDGVVDAWAYRDAHGQIVRIEVSKRRDGMVDRWEHYEKGQLARVEEDTDRNGRVDRWSTYDAGILMDTVSDANGDGRPDGTPLP
jgi:hypothetical protein